MLGDADEVLGALRAWVAQAVTWHDPALLGVALAAANAEALESETWSWLKWLPHSDIPGQIDGVGPARYLAAGVPELAGLLSGELADREPFGAADTAPLRHLLIVVDNPHADLGELLPRTGLAGVTVVQRGTEQPEYPDPERLVLRVAGGPHRAVGGGRVAVVLRCRRRLFAAGGRTPGARSRTLGLQPEPGAQHRRRPGHVRHPAGHS
ncbi:hypothetical protein MAUB1S_11572 [Mycolicibacterium aubagnense]